MKTRDTSKITTIFVHHSQSEWGDASVIKEWHTDQGWDDVGYNSIIKNCYPTHSSFQKGEPDLQSDGVEELGRDVKYIPAGVRGHNTNSVHICLIGDRTFTSSQLITLKHTIEWYKGKYPSIDKVLRHADADERKPTCPSLSSKFIRELLR
jgi:hypothetical protein